jgi:biotin carboxylase
LNKKINLLVLPSVQNIDEIIENNLSKINLTKGHFKDIQFQQIDNCAELSHLGISLDSFDTVWLSSFWGSRDLAYGISVYLNAKNITHTFVEQSTSKITDQISFSTLGINSPNTFFTNSIHLINYVNEIERICGYPLIMKDTRGFKGKGSVLVKNHKQLIESLLNLNPNIKYFFQSFIPNDYDWGILVENGEVVSAEMSYHQTGEFRNHAFRGATEIFVDLEQIPQIIKDMAIGASQALNLSWSRADIIVDKYTNTPYLLEVNRSPGITTNTSEVSGARQFLMKQLNIAI